MVIGSSETAPIQEKIVEQPEPGGGRWGEHPSEERKIELEERLRTWEAEPDHGNQRGPFARQQLSGADVYWLAVLSLDGTAGEPAQAEQDLRAVLVVLAPPSASRPVGANLSEAQMARVHLRWAQLLKISPSDAQEQLANGNEAGMEKPHIIEAQLKGADLRGAQLKGAYLSGAQMEGADLRWTHLEGAQLWGAHLEGTHLEGAYLEGAYLRGAHLEGADLRGAHLEGADFGGAHLEGAILKEVQLQGVNLSGAQMEGADLRGAHLEGADLRGAQLEGAYLRGTQLEGTDLRGAQLEGADLSEAHLEGADLRAATFDRRTRLNDVHLNEARLDQVTFDNTNLTVLPWREVVKLGEELAADEADRSERLDKYRVAARAYRALSVALLDQGIKDATRFRHRSEVMERKARWWDMKKHLNSREHFITALALFGGWLVSGCLDLFTGYGHRIERLFLTYFGIVCAFAAAYFLLTQQVFTLQHPLETLDHILNMLAFSAMAFHGRGILAADLSTLTGYAFQPRWHDLGNWLGGIESIFGLLIEGLFVAAFARRVTGG